jgi:hypothetical protein
MTTHELYFLILVCGAFAVLGLGLAIATYVYRRSLSHAQPVRSAAPKSVGGTTAYS